VDLGTERVGGDQLGGPVAHPGSDDLVQGVPGLRSGRLRRLPHVGEQAADRAQLVLAEAAGGQ
jgi:hypothetical protein